MDRNCNRTCFSAPLAVPQSLPVVLTRDEVAAGLRHLPGPLARGYAPVQNDTCVRVLRRPP
jgi:hypothetical protein